MREPEPSKTMSQSEPRPLPLILALDTIVPMHLPWVGPKAYNLSRMMAEGFPVPPGFCLTTHAFPEIASKDGWEWISKLEQMNTADATQQLLYSVRGRLTHFWLDPALQFDIQKHLAGLGPELVAVRSSATAEDLPDRSSAGQYESILDVQGFDACDQAIRQCWLSLWSDRAFVYRKANGIDHATARMAVIVQRMIAAEVSGIAFTADPITGNRDHLVVEAAPGPGEAIVQGKVVPDRILIDKTSGDIIHQTLASDRS
jgi:phosphoenolpyruvate synthase/pyruvate phosphate dikinase